VALTFTAKAGDDGRLFGSVTASDIAEQLAERGHVIDKRKIELDHPLKELGFHTVAIKLPHDVHAELKVTVAAES
jgi:large subunit ribosomal protein L9